MRFLMLPYKDYDARLDGKHYSNNISDNPS
jgi:hypothetical protein